jgi:hypothetical protein
MDLGGLAQSAGSGLSNLFQNKLFLQYLSGAGGALSAGQPVGPAIHDITQKTIGAQSQAALNQQYMEMLRKMLSGEEVPAGGKVTIDEKGTKLEVPKGMGAIGAPGAVGTPTPTPTGTPAPMSLPTMPGSAQLGAINPFAPSQPSISAADLAGLGPQDVSRALSGATSIEALRQQSIANILSARQPLEEDFPVKVPMGPEGILTTVSLREWKALPQDERDYALFVQASENLGDTDIISRREFKMLEPTEREQFVRAAMKDPAMKAVAKELSRAGAPKISIGEKIAGKVAEKKALGKLKGQLYFSDPDWIDDIDKRLGSEDIQREIFMESQKEGGDPELMRAKKTIKFIEDKISVGGAIQDVKLSADGKTMTWTVRWKSGDVEDISYVVRP